LIQLSGLDVNNHLAPDYPSGAEGDFDEKMAMLPVWATQELGVFCYLFHATILIHW
jgi:hypothetical protein